MLAEVHAGATAAYQVPGPLDSFAPRVVRVDGQDSFAATRLDNGFLYVRLTPGIHQVELRGPLPRGQSLTLSMGTPPQRVSVDAKGYAVEGLSPEGRVEGSLSLRREVDLPGGDDQEEVTQALPPWLLVRRELSLGVRFRVRTQVRRMGPSNTNVVIRLPLLPGEQVTENGFASENGVVVVELAPGQRETSFQSTLSTRAELTFRAAVPSPKAEGPIVHPYSETWQVIPSALYRVRFEGISPVTRVEADGGYAPVYRPWPGEELRVFAHKLEAAPGASVTIDRAELELSPGTRMEQARFHFEARTSGGSTERITLPKDATLTGISVDGAPRSARMQDGVLELQLDPGAHRVEVTYQRGEGLMTAYAPAQVKLSRPLTNLTTRVILPNDRWLLWAHGPSWGPAVLFWGYLLVVLLVGGALGRVPYTPLKTHEWLLLGLGLTMVDVVVALFVVGWLFALALRKQHAPRGALAFNVVQVGLVLLTLAALSCLFHTVHQGLVVQPDMQVQGQNSSNGVLQWYADRIDGALPAVQVFSIPLWIYKGLMLLWALWLAASLLRWLRFGWDAFRTGESWRAVRRAHPAAPQNPKVPLEDIERAQAELDATRAVDSTREPGDDA
jgi:hypothetical protein